MGAPLFGGRHTKTLYTRRQSSLVNVYYSRRSRREILLPSDEDERKMRGEEETAPVRRALFFLNTYISIGVGVVLLFPIFLLFSRPRRRRRLFHRAMKRVALRFERESSSNGDGGSKSQPNRICSFARSSSSFRRLGSVVQTDASLSLSLSQTRATRSC